MSEAKHVVVAEGNQDNETFEPPNSLPPTHPPYPITLFYCFHGIYHNPKLSNVLPVNVLTWNTFFFNLYFGHKPYKTRELITLVHHHIPSISK